MLFRLFKLRFLKTVRSVSFGQKLVTGFFLTGVGLFMLSNILAVGLTLESIVKLITGSSDVITFLNTSLLYFFMVELMYRFMMQKTSAIDIENFLHLPIGRPVIIHYLLLTSFVSAMNIVPFLLFGPVAFGTISSQFGVAGAISWGMTIIGISWTLHWFSIWFKQKYSENVAGNTTLLVLMLATAGTAYYGIFNAGEWLSPFFDASFQNYLPPVLALTACVSMYFITFNYYKKHAYLEELTQEENSRTINPKVSFFDRFGLAGDIADLELKLVLRHKRSRVLLIISFLFLFYGLFYYTNEEMQSSYEFSVMSIFIGIFITGIFIMNYAQLFLSWNSPHFDFFAARHNGIKALVTGKYLLISAITFVCFLLSIPYVYFGWEVLFVNLACFLFNIGVNLHMMIYMALWKPKPIDLQKGGMFNYEGIGAAQLLAGIPIFLLPYLVYLPVSLLFNQVAGIAVLGIAGLMGILFYREINQMHVNRLRRKRYVIATSFRQEL